MSKLASGLHAQNETLWYPYGLGVQTDTLRQGLKNPNELISRQFVLLWEMISPVGHILYVAFEHGLASVTHPSACLLASSS